MSKFIEKLFNKEEVNGQNWRWIFVIFLPAILGLLAASMIFLLNFVQIYIFNSSNLWMFDYLIPIGASVAAAWALIQSAYHLAPKFKLGTCKIYTIFFGLLAVFALVVTSLNSSPEPGEWLSVIRTWIIFIVATLTTKHLKKSSN